MGLMGGWWLLGLVVVILIIWAVVRAAGSQGIGRDEQSPEAILKRRHTRGEVDRDEYQRRLTDLKK